MKIINSTSNPLIKEFTVLHSKKGRDKQNQFLLEGHKVVEEALNCGIKLKYVAVNESYKGCTELLNKINEYFIFSEACFKKVSTTNTPVNIIAIAEKFFFKIDDIFKKPDKDKLLIILDEIRDPGNLGSIIRTAAAANIDGIIITNCSVDIYNTKVIRSTTGCLWKIPIIYFDDKAKLIKLLKSKMFEIYTTSTSADCLYTEVNYNKNIALVFGSESTGVSDIFGFESNKKIKIPTRKNIESLNLASSVAIIIYEAIRQKGLNFD